MTALLPYTPIPADSRRALRLMFIAKHAKWEGGLHPEDGNHALYHAEMREILLGLGLNLVIEDSYSALFSPPPVDFVFPLLNRGGFLNSEMLLPLLCNRKNLPFLGASPILRGLADDKHLTKLAASARQVPTAPWKVFRRGAPVERTLCPPGGRLVIKPNASSASWGVSDATDWQTAHNAIARIHAEGHDAIVEPFVPGDDVEVPVITVNGLPFILPMMIYEQSDPSALRTYQEKRDLVDTSGSFRLVPFRDPVWQARIAVFTDRLIEEYWPFDYGRFEFRLDRESGQLHFVELNLNCNLWSRKTIGRAARMGGLTHSQLVETILGESMARQGLIRRDAARAA